MAEPIIDPQYAIISESEEFIVVEKSGNCPVHEGGLYKENCLTRMLEKEAGYRLLPVYRLDRETSGIIVFAKRSKDVKQIFDSIIYKEYIAICEGSIDKAQLIDKPIGECKGNNINWKKCVADSGKESRTFIEPLLITNEYTVLKIIPMTGRQHQIRVHLASIGHPILFDKVYGKSDKMFKDYLDGKAVSGRQLLHLHKIVIAEQEFICELPADMSSYIN